MSTGLEATLVGKAWKGSQEGARGGAIFWMGWEEAEKPQVMRVRPQAGFSQALCG